MTEIRLNSGLQFQPRDLPLTQPEPRFVSHRILQRLSPAYRKFRSIQGSKRAKAGSQKRRKVIQPFRSSHVVDRYTSSLSSYAARPELEAPEKPPQSS